VAELPSGTETFLFTDLEVSTRLWEREPGAMREALARHDAILRESVALHGGQVVKGTGDGVHAVFATADAAVKAAVDAQLGIGAEQWTVSDRLRVRMGVHTGSAELRDADYFGPSVNRAARLMSVAHGGQIVVSAAAEELSREALPEGVTVTDLGLHRLRDLGAPERVFQVLHADLDREFPPLASMDAHSSNLPAQLTSFVGREPELASIAEVLKSARLVTLTGVGGVGKTRLAIQVGAEHLSEFADGVWLCELAAAGDPEAMVQVVAGVLSVSSRPDEPLDARIREALQAKQTLIILDNCEHVLDTASALATGILRACPGVRILATSREALDVHGERVTRVRSLPLPGDHDDVGQLVATDAVRLFADRASAVEPDFIVSDANAASVVQICRRLDGIPLAIELAASRAVSLSPAEIVALLDERFRLLTGGKRTTVDRHQTLRATIDWSYALLSAAEQVVFERLGVFAGSFDAAAVTAVAGGDLDGWVLRDALARLVRKSMVNLVIVDDQSSRYQLLETLRSYARERLEDHGKADAVRRRHAAHYAQQAERMVQALVTGVGLEAAHRASLLDVDDTRAAISWSLDSPDPKDGELALRIAARFGGAPPGTRQAAGVTAAARRLLERAERSSPELKAAVMAGFALDALFLEGDLDRATDLAHEALANMPDEFRQSPTGSVVPYSVLTFCAIAKGDFDDARELLDEARRRSDTTEHNTAFWESHAALVERAAGDGVAARRHAETAVQLARRADFPFRLAQALSILAGVTVRNDPSTARAAIEELATLERAYPHLGRAGGSHGTALVSAKLSLGAHDHRAALQTLRAAAELARDNGIVSAVGIAAVLIGVLARLHQPRHAATLAGVLTKGPYGPLLLIAAEPEALQLHLANLRDELGQDDYTTATAAGAAMHLDAIIDTIIAAIDEALAALRTTSEPHTEDSRDLLTASNNEGP
jgi:predicted ATPase/class 3 adenylate cyclase